MLAARAGAGGRAASGAYRGSARGRWSPDIVAAWRGATDRVTQRHRLALDVDLGPASTSRPVSSVSWRWLQPQAATCTSVGHHLPFPLVSTHAHASITRTAASRALSTSAGRGPSSGRSRDSGGRPSRSRARPSGYSDLLDAGVALHEWDGAYDHDSADRGTAGRRGGSRSAAPPSRGRRDGYPRRDEDHQSGARRRDRDHRRQRGGPAFSRRHDGGAKGPRAADAATQLARDGAEYLFGYHAVAQALWCGSRPATTRLFLQDSLVEEAELEDGAGARFVAAQGKGKGKSRNSGGGGSKAANVTQVLALAAAAQVPVSLARKDVLNSLAASGGGGGGGGVGARPSAVTQGIVLETAPLDVPTIASYADLGGMLACSTNMTSAIEAPIVLALDEAWDPMNVGALLRSAAFLGCDAVVVSAKNSAPLSPTVSKASTGALEVFAGSGRVARVRNMPQFLQSCADAGWRVAGTALPSERLRCPVLPVGGAREIEDAATALTRVAIAKHGVSGVTEMQVAGGDDVAVAGFDEHEISAGTILVMGNEAYGLRTNVLSTCDVCVFIPSRQHVRSEGPSGRDGLALGAAPTLDSLNVSNAGAVTLQFLQAVHAAEAGSVAVDSPASAASHAPTLAGPPGMPMTGAVPPVYDSSVGHHVHVHDDLAVTETSEVPDVDGLPSLYCSVMDNKDDGLPRLGLFDVHAGTMTAVEVMGTLAGARDLEAITAHPTIAGRYFLVQSDGRVYEADLQGVTGGSDGTAASMVTLTSFVLPCFVDEAYTNIESLEVLDAGEEGLPSDEGGPDTLLIRYAVRGGGNQFGNLPNITVECTYVKVAEPGLAGDLALYRWTRRGEPVRGRLDAPRDCPPIRQVSDTSSGLVSSTTDVAELGDDHKAAIVAAGGNPDEDVSVLWDADGTFHVVLHGTKVEGVHRSPSNPAAADVVSDDEAQGTILYRIHANQVVGARRITSMGTMGSSGIAPAVFRGQ